MVGASGEPSTTDVPAGTGALDVPAGTFFVSRRRHLDVLGGARPANGEQSLFGLRSRDPRQGMDLRVRQLTTGEGLRQPRQRPQCPRDADVLASGTGLEPDAPGQPRRTRAEAIAPAAAGVELANEIEQPRGRRIQMRGELGDLVAKALKLSSVRGVRFNDRIRSDAEIGAHGRDLHVLLRRL
jgi:hypothetical protein